MITIICDFDSGPLTTFSISYRTTTSGSEGLDSTIFYRKNEGPWQSINNINAYQGPTYLSVFSVYAHLNDKFEYFFTDQLGSNSYNFGFNGTDSGFSGIQTTICTAGANQVYFNICSITFGTTAYFCSFN